ncbi:MAG TPA: HEAT repeat domain-containing protein, partial [Gemmataceae bacterium]|nr:HEAT repeat domain-containing protein [Gemmataceae bacterium]
MKTRVTLLALVWLVASWAAADQPNDKVAALVKDLHSQDEFVRLTATLELGKLGKQAVEPAAALLADKDDDVRYYAVWALGLIGPDAKDKTGEVIKLLGDRSEQVRRKAAFA